jgi:hypothetical protein
MVPNQRIQWRGFVSLRPLRNGVYKFLRLPKLAPRRRSLVSPFGRDIAVKLYLTKIELKEANEFVAALHRHHKPVVGHKFSLGAIADGKLVGVAIVGRPVARMRDDGTTLEVTRLCTDGTRNACSFLYGASARAAFALGYRRIGTYILASEPGASLMGAGWRLMGERGGGSWSRGTRPRTDKAPTESKLLFEVTC